MPGVFSNFVQFDSTAQAINDGNSHYLGIGNGTDAGFPPAIGHNFNGTQKTFIGFAVNSDVWGNTNWHVLVFADPSDNGNGFSFGDTGIAMDTNSHTFQIKYPCPHPGSRIDFYMDSVLVGTTFRSSNDFPDDSGQGAVSLDVESNGAFSSVSSSANFGGCVVSVSGIIDEPQIDAFPSANLAGTFFRFRLRNFAGTVPRWTGATITVTATCAAGAISQAIIPNSAITPAGTYYTVEEWSNGRITSSANYVLNTSVDLSNATPR